MNTFENSTKKLISFILFLFFILSINFFLNWRIIKPPIFLSTQESKITIDKNLIEILSAGNRRFVSSIYWTETLLDSDLAHYKDDDLNSWMYQRFDTITSLDPKFYQAYLFGGIYLSIVKDDEKGAKAIYEKGLIHFPTDLDLLYNAGFNDYFELNNAKDAIEKFDKIAASEKGFSKYPFIVSLSQRLKAAEGMSLKEIYKYLYETYQKASKTPFLKKHYSRTLYGLKAEIDLECLNKLKLKTCSKNDFNGNPYRYSKMIKEYKAVLKWKKFKVHKKLEN